MVLRKMVSREQLLSNSRAWRTTSRRTTSHQGLAGTAQTNLESLLLERLLLHLCVLARAHRRKSSLPRFCGERVLLRVIDTLRPIGFGLPTRPLFSTPDEVFGGNTHFYRPNTARICTSGSYGTLLAAHTVASPGCFLCLYCRRSRTLCGHCFDDCSAGTARPLARLPF